MSQEKLQTMIMKKKKFFFFGGGGGWGERLKRCIMEFVQEENENIFTARNACWLNVFC